MAILNGENHLLQDPKGVDFAVQNLQHHLYKNLNWDKVQMFGRVERVPLPENKVGFEPKAYYTGGQYKNVLRDDNYNANVFFSLSDRHLTNEGYFFRVDCRIVFMLNAKKIFPGSQERNDTRAQEDVIKALKMQQSFKPETLSVGVTESLEGFDTTGIKFTNVYPDHVFCVTGILSYQITC